MCGAAHPPALMGQRAHIQPVSLCACAHAGPVQPSMGSGCCGRAADRRVAERVLARAGGAAGAPERKGRGPCVLVGGAGGHPLDALPVCAKVGWLELVGRLIVLADTDEEP